MGSPNPLACLIPTVLLMKIGGKLRRVWGLGWSGEGFLLFRFATVLCERPACPFG